MGKKTKQELELENKETLAENGKALQEDTNIKTNPEDVQNSKDQKKKIAEDKKAAKKQAALDKEAEEIAKENAAIDAKKAKKEAKKAAKLAKKQAKKEKQKKAKNVLLNDIERGKWVKSYFKKNDGLADPRMKELMDKDFAKMFKRAHLMLNITEQDYEKVFVLQMPDSYSNKNKVNYRLDKMENGSQTLIYDQAFLNVLFFGEDVLYNYYVNVDFNNGYMTNDHSIAVRYFDIVSIESKLTYDQMESPKYLQYHVILHLTNNQQITLNLRNQRLYGANVIPSLLTTQEQRIVKLLREKMQK